MSNALLDVLYHHQSMRNYIDKPLTPEQINAIENAVMQTSSSCFFQIVTVIRVTDQDKKAQIAKLAGGQNHIAKCAEFWMFCIDFRKLMQANNLTLPLPFKLFYSGLNDVSLACQQALVAAEALNLGGVIIGGYKPGIQEVTKLLNIQPGMIPALGLCLGVPDESYREEQKPRLPKSWIFMENAYHDPYNVQELNEYNQKVRAYYKNRKFGARDDDWSNSTKNMLPSNVDLANAIKSPLASYIESQGFSLQY